MSAPRIRKIHLSPNEQSLDEHELGENPPKALACAYHITDAFSTSDLQKLNSLRTQIPLDVSRPTCPRRFLTEKNCLDNNDEFAQKQHQEDGWVGALIDAAVSSWKLQPKHCLTSLPWYRYLEYTDPGGHMAKHTDGSNVHPTTGARSVATMLLYLSTCHDAGGETTLYRKREKKQKKKQQASSPPSSSDCLIIESVRPIYNTVLIFPHGWQHSGDPVIQDPKIVLRVDLAWKVSATTADTAAATDDVRSDTVESSRQI